ncbi:MAG: hypothetical protein J7M39_05810 [Anaerolineae bacterium]|nr:hypothetical protein [Anaerolineae bacterium]
MKKQLLAVILSVSAVTWILSGCGGQTPDPVDASAPPEAVSAAADTAAETVPDAVEDTEDSADQPATQATATPAPQAAGDDEAVLSDILMEDYEDALSARNQLALGTLRLAETEEAVTEAQGQELLFYWQALKALTADTTTASEETSAVQDQLFETMTAEQLASIRSMALTNADLTAFYTEMGIEMPTPDPDADVDPDAEPQGARGGMSDLTPEEREAVKATATALGTPTGEGGGSGAGRRDVLIDAVIEYLSTETTG